VVSNHVLTHYPAHASRGALIPTKPLTQYLEDAAKCTPEKTAIVFEGSTLTYAELLARVESLAAHLHNALQVKHGDRVILLSQNCPEYIVAFYAIMRAGAVVVPINPMCKADEVAFYVQDTDARVAIVQHDLLASFPSNTLSIIDMDSRLRGNDGLVNLPAHPDVNSLCVLPYTSGTTAHPKGCMHTHATVLASLLASQQWRKLDSNAVCFCVAPMFHMLGMQNGMNMPLTLGSTLVMMRRWDAGTAAELIEQHRVTTWTAPPAMLIDFFAHPEAKTRDLSSLSLLTGGGAAMPEAIANMLKERFNLSYNEGYGLTETASFLHSNPVERGKRQCLGLPTQGVDSRIVDPETLRELAQGEMGELVTNGAQVMQGYWRNDAANQTAFIEINGKRFFRTGDLASVDEDGYFFMRDRLKRMVNVSGYKVWPSEVESMLYQHPSIHEACVIGVPDKRSGERVVALVVLKANADVASEQALIEWMRSKMAVYKAPKEVRLMANLPKSNTGKILWRQLQEQEKARHESYF
jgi:fatty-acyl-CoA synthase